MECRQCEKMLAPYLLGELDAGKVEALEAHLAACSSCRQEVEAYKMVVGCITGAPSLSPSPDESTALASALAQVRLPQPASRQVDLRPAKELLAFALASVAVFVLVAVVLGLQTFGYIDILWRLNSINPFRIALVAVIAVFVTSFIPIWVTARRRPLNGLTFSR